MTLRLAGFILLALYSGISPSMAAGRGVVEPFIVGPWRGEAGFKDALFSHCLMRTFQNGWGIYIGMYANKATRLGLHSDVLGFTKGKMTRVWIQLDERPPSTHAFKAVQKKTIGMQLSPAMAAQLSAAGRMRLRVGDLSADLTLLRTGEAFRQLAACAEKGRRIRSGVTAGAGR